jgi:hypothetical protein
LVKNVNSPKGGRKEGKKYKHNSKTHHICVATRHNETHWKLLSSTEWGEKVRKGSGGSYS